MATMLLVFTLLFYISMFTIVLFNRYWLKCVYQTAGNHCSPSLLLIVWGFFPDFFVIGHLSQGSVTSQPPRTRSFISAWSSPPQFNRFAHFLGQQDMYSRPLRNPPLHNCEKHWAHTSPGAQTCRIKRSGEVRRVDFGIPGASWWWLHFRLKS